MKLLFKNINAKKVYDVYKKSYFCNEKKDKLVMLDFGATKIAIFDL